VIEETVPAPRTDDEVAAWARDLGLPGIVDVHVHFLPPRMMRRVWAYFAEAGPLVGQAWPIIYQWPDDQRVAHLTAMGVRRFGALAYAHRPDMAADLNDWTLDFADRVPECIPSMTFFPEPNVERYVAEAIERGARLAKLHLQVGGFDPTDRRLDPVWGRLAELALPIVVHAGSGPVRHRHTGPGPIGEVLRRHPGLVAIIAHMGAPEYEGFIELAQRYERVCLDTTMVGTDFFDDLAPISTGLMPIIQQLGLNGNILLGSDFPNIPYPYAHQISSLARWGLGTAWMRAICWDNPVSVLDRYKLADRPATS
jgi:uncharacterized protein